VDPDQQPPPTITRHPHLKAFAEIGHAFRHYLLDPPEGHAKLGGTVKMQVARSCADWSHGSLKEHSIQNAYRQLIMESNHCIYIENQFFITTTGTKKTPVQNTIGLALVDRIVSAAKSNKRFQCIILIPAVPGFAGNLDEKGASGTLAILGGQLRSISEIFDAIRAAGFNPDDYISFYNLRSYDRINHDPERIKRMEEKSGVTWFESQAALARYVLPFLYPFDLFALLSYLSPHSLRIELISISDFSLQLGRNPTEDELRKNKMVRIAVPREGGEQAALSDDARSKEKVAASEVKLPLPETYEEAESIVRRFEQADDVHESISDSVAHHAQKGTGSLFDEKWAGSKESERNAYVTEETYIHCKLMIGESFLADPDEARS